LFAIVFLKIRRCIGNLLKNDCFLSGMFCSYPLVRVFGVLRDAKKPLSVREVAKQSDIAPSTASRSLIWLRGQGVVTWERTGTTYQYALFRDDPLVKHLLVCWTLSELRSAQITEQIKKQAPSVLSIALFGSSARGEDDPKSDVDIIAITRKKEKVMLGTSRGREIQLVIVTLDEWRKKASGNNVFYKSVIRDAISLLGERPEIA